MKQLAATLGVLTILLLLGGAAPHGQHPDDLLWLQIDQKEQGLGYWLGVDYEESNRIRPVYMLAVWAGATVFGNSTTVYHILLFVLWVVTVLVAARLFRQWGASYWTAWVLACVLLTGPAIESWLYYLFSEPFAMLFFLLALLNSRKPWLGLLFLLLAALSKEVMLLAIPAYIWLRYREDRLQIPDVLAGLFMLGMLWFIRTYNSTTLNDEYGFSLNKTDLSMLASATADVLLTAYGGFSLLIVAGFVLARRPKSAWVKWAGFALLLIVPQILIYLLTGFRAGRYLLPAQLGLLAFIIPAIENRLLRYGVVGLLAIQLFLSIQLMQAWSDTVLPYRTYVQELGKYNAFTIVCDHQALNYEADHIATYYPDKQISVWPVNVLGASPRLKKQLLSLNRLPIAQSDTFAVVSHLPSVAHYPKLLSSSMEKQFELETGGYMPVLGAKGIRHRFGIYLQH